MYVVSKGPRDARIGIVLLHGGLANHEVWERYAAPLVDKYRVVTPDLRGSGRSHFAGPLTWELLADDVAALARSIACEIVVVGGISFGAGVAVATALRHPTSLHGLVILTPAFAGDDTGFTPAQAAAMRAMADAGARTATLGMAALDPLLATLPEAIRERARATIATYDPASTAETTRFMAAGGQPFATAAALSSIAVPTLLVPGTDPTHPPEVSDQYAAHLRPATTTVTRADPTAYAAAIDAWLVTTYGCVMR